jgi:hypothetical protein
MMPICFNAFMSVAPSLLFQPSSVNNGVTGVNASGGTLSDPLMTEPP